MAQTDQEPAEPSTSVPAPALAPTSEIKTSVSEGEPPVMDQDNLISKNSEHNDSDDEDEGVELDDEKLK